MALTSCPMCKSPIAPVSGEMAKACDNCGADLSRWLPKPAAPPPPITAMSPEVKEEDAGEFNLSRGILGAFVGALVGAGAMYGFYELAGFRFPLLGVGIGALTGYGAKHLFKGTDSTLGIISGGIALVAVVGTLYLMYGTFPIISIISVVVSVSVAYRIASG
jgi:hypothetical protein